MAADIDSKELIELACAGDDDAFSRLVERYQNTVYTVTYRFTRNSEDALDLAQEAFLKAWRALPSFRGESSFATWLCRIAYNACLDFTRREKRHDAVSLTVEDDDGEVREQDVRDVDIASDPQQMAERSEKQQMVRRALDELNDKQRIVLVLRDIEGYSYEEIARILDVDIGTVKSRINRGRQKFKEILAEWNLF